MFITSNSYQDLQGLCLGILYQPFQVVYDCQSTSSAFLYRCLQISRERGGKIVQLMCPGADALHVFDTVLACRSCSVLICQMDNCL